MFLFVILLAGILTVPLAGGRLGRLADLRIRGFWLLAGALGTQLAILQQAEIDLSLAAVLHIVSYVMGGIFLVMNRDFPGFWVIVAGGGCNFLAILANGGVMPAAQEAVREAGGSNVVAGFANSAVVPDANLSFLGDIFALPASWPLANVFSIGDVLIVCGLVVGLHRFAGSRLFRSRRGPMATVAAHRDFRLLWMAHAGSSVGDWVYALAVAAILVERSGNGQALAFLLILQGAGGVLGGFVGGPLIDRFPRRNVMIVSDLLRAVAVLTLFIGSAPGLLHLSAVALVLGFFEVMFQSALQAAIPTLVPKRLVVAANGLISLTFNMALMVGPLLGGFAVAKLGFEPALMLNAATFLVSLGLVAAARLPSPDGGSERTPHLRSLREGIRYCARVPIVRGILAVTGIVMIGVALRAPFEPVLVMNDMARGPEGLGLAAALWGAGMMAGSGLAPAALKAHGRSRRVAQTIAVTGLCAVAAAFGGFHLLLLVWFVAGMANTIGTVAYESMLQQHTPDEVRGRVIASSEAVMNVAYLLGLGAAGMLGGLGARPIFVISGVLFVLAGAVSIRMVREPTPRLEPRGAPISA